MNTDINQAMHVEAAKSFSSAKANSTNNYDKTRMKLNFEIDSDGKLHLLGYSEKSLETRLQERLSELG